MIIEVRTENIEEEICGLRYESTTIPRIGETISIKTKDIWLVVKVDHWIVPNDDSGYFHKQKSADVTVKKI